MQKAENETIEEALEKTQFDTVWDILQAMKEQDESLAEIIGQMKEELGRSLGFNDNRLRERIEILGPKLCIEKLRKSITSMIVDKLGSDWDERFGELVRFKEENGHCNVPIKFSANPLLGIWVSTQRTRYKKGTIRSYQIEKLKSIDFSWEQLKDAFQVQYDYLLRFRKVYPHRWPKQKEEFPEGNPLGRWCAQKRSNKTNLEKWKIDLLSIIGFPWNLLDEFFEIRYNALIEFKKSHPSRWPNYDEKFSKDIKLQVWCDSIRQRYKKKSIKEWQVKKLNSINFPWNLEEFYWMQQYEYLIEFRKINSKRWPKNDEVFPNENKLGMWCSTQQDRFKRSTLLDWQIKRLNEIAFPFKKEKLMIAWLKQYNYLLDFRKIYCNRWPTNIEQYPNQNKLGYWCKRQRCQLKNLANWQIEKLNKIRFPWAVDLEKKYQNNWIKKYNFLVEFRKIFPHRWPNRGEKFPGNNTLGKWCHDQAYRKNQLSEWRIEKLNEIGFPWKT